MTLPTHQTCSSLEGNESQGNAKKVRFSYSFSAKIKNWLKMTDRRIPIFCCGGMEVCFKSVICWLNHGYDREEKRLKRTVSGGVLLIVLMSILALTLSVPSVKATGTIYIRADGSIDPPTAPIQRNGTVYTFTANITSDAYAGIEVQRNIITIDGNGYTLKGSNVVGSVGINVTGISNVKIKNITIKTFYVGIFLCISSGDGISGNNIIANGGSGIAFFISSNSSISGNSITMNTWYGIYLDASSNYNNISGNNVAANEQEGILLSDSSSYNTISGNKITNNNCGIDLDSSSSYNTVSGNNITDNGDGVDLWSSSTFNTISGNNIVANNYDGIVLDSSSNNAFFHNYIVGNPVQVNSQGSISSWDDGYPSGGNYWGDYTTRYPGALEIDASRIWNTPYVIDASNRDHYPLLGPWTSGGENVTVTPASGVSLTFANVISEGITTVNEAQSGPSVPAGCKIEGRYFDIKTTATLSGSVTIRIIYNDTSMTLWEEETLRLMRWNATSQQWQDITTHVDTVNNVIYGETNHLSMFGITAGPVPGDINRDGVVDISDAAQIGIWWQKAAPPAPANVDITGDGYIDISDAAVLGINWQKHT